MLIRTVETGVASIANYGLRLDCPDLSPSRRRLDPVAFQTTMSASGTIVVLNGPSSAGKTTLALAVRARVGVTAAAVSIDKFFPFMHPEARNNWRMFSTLTDAAFATAAALATGGFHVVVDTVFERPESLSSAERAFASHAHHFVAVTCDLGELERREAERGDRRIGQAREQHTRVLQNATYTLRLDTSRSSVEECVEQIVRLLDTPRSELRGT